MGSVDYEARWKAYKGLAVIFIVLIALTNLCLLVRVFIASGGLCKILTGPRGPRYQIFISLIIGDIFVAIFSLAVSAKMTYEEDRTFSCRTAILATRYMVFIMPFVYGVGLVVLGAECIRFRWRLRSASPVEEGEAIVSLVAGAVPWLLGIILALPLNIADVDLSGNDQFYCDTHLTHSRLRAIVSICLVIPAAAVLVFAFVNCMVSSPPPVYEQPSLATQQPNNTALTSPAPPAASNSEQPPTYEESQEAMYKQGPGLTYPPPPIACSQAFQPGMQPQPQPLGGVAQCNNPYYGQQYQFGQPANQTAYLPPGIVTYTPTGQIVMIQSPPDMRSFYSDKEPKVFLVVSFLYCLCVLPYALYYLNDNSSPLDPALGKVIAKDVVYWTLLVRSILLPSVWALSGTFLKPRNLQVS